MDFRDVPNILSLASFERRLGVKLIIDYQPSLKASGFALRATTRQVGPTRRKIKYSKHFKSRKMECLLPNTSKAFPACGLTKTALIRIFHKKNEKVSVFFLKISGQFMDHRNLVATKLRYIII